MGSPYEVEHRIQEGSTGGYRWFLARAMPHKDDQGTTLKWFGTSTDIEDQKRTEQRIKASEENSRVLAETVLQLVCIIQTDVSAISINKSYYDYTDTCTELTKRIG